MGLTASFLPKPVVGVNGSGMHTTSPSAKNGKNLFWDPKGEEKLSKPAGPLLTASLPHGNDICLLLNASVNAYRRLDPHFEAPNQIKASPVDRGSMIRIPIGNEKSMRVEVRSVSPDSNPYLVMYSIFKAGIDGETAKIKNLRQAERYLPDNIYTAIDLFEKAEWTTKLLGADVKGRYADLKRGSGRPLPPRPSAPSSKHPKSNTTTRSTTSSSGTSSRIDFPLGNRMARPLQSDGPFFIFSSLRTLRLCDLCVKFLVLLPVEFGSNPTDISILSSFSDATNTHCFHRLHRAVREDRVPSLHLHVLH